MSNIKKKETVTQAMSRIMAPYQYYRISYENINDFNYPEPQIFGTILMDTNLTCNLRCMYCHNDRSNNLVKEEDFLRFIHTQIKSVGVFQLGCAMEPTMDKRLGDFVKIIGNSHAKPSGDFRIQTNGTLLHKHDWKIWQDSGVNKLCVSLDTINPEVHKILRDDSNLEQILKNINDIRKKWKKLELWIISTICKENAKFLPELVKYAVDVGIDGIEIRNMFYYPDSTVIKNHDKMKSVILDSNVFNKLVQNVKNKWERDIEFSISDSVKISVDIQNQITIP